MVRVRYSTLWLLLALLLMLLVLVALRGALQQAHVDDTIHFVASDAGAYYSLYEEDLYESLDRSESLGLFLVGSPILLVDIEYFLKKIGWREADLTAYLAWREPAHDSFASEAALYAKLLRLQQRYLPGR